MIFASNFFAILPMAWLIGKATEDLSASTSEILAGLLNASFGNIVEMLLCINGIRQNQILLIQCTLIGSILSNMLLVMGTAFIVGGIHYKIQHFSELSASMQTSLMLLSVLAISLPTLYCTLVPGNDSIEPISRGCAILLFVMYAQYLIFQLHTHSEYIQEEESAVKNVKEGKHDAGTDEDDQDDDSDEDDEVDLSPVNATILLAALTIFTAVCSDYLIASMQGFMDTWHVSREFIGVIVLPIIGNAAEHWLVGTPMTLDFHPFQAMVLLLSVLIVSNILADKTSNWLVGSMLCAAYSAIALIYYKSSPPEEQAVYN